MSANLRAFLGLLRWCEGTDGPNGYRMLFGGELFDSLADHPRRLVTATLGGKPIASTAAGAYQFLERTWDECRQALSLLDFSEQSQDLAAMWLIRRRGALEDVEAGRLESALAKCAKEWASLPGSPYGQPTKTYAACERKYIELGGRFSSIDTPDETIPFPFPTSQPEVAPMAPLIAAAIPSLIQMVPDLIRVFGSGGQVTERNAKAAEMVAGIAKQSTGTTTLEEALQKLQGSSEAQALFRNDVQARWYDLAEFGGGVEKAAERSLKMQGERGPWMNPALWVTGALLPMVYMVVYQVVFGHAADWPSEIRVMVVTAVVTGTLGSITGFFLGSSMSSRSKDEAILRR